MNTCPTCGMPVRTFEGDEGTCGYEPLSEEQRAAIRAVLDRDAAKGDGDCGDCVHE